MEEIIRVFIYIHAFFGGLGLISGIGSIVVKKGSIPHKRFGKLFSIGMLVSSLISIPIACLPNHQNIFLLLIGLFTIYLVISGNKALTFKSKAKTAATVTDKITSGSMFFFSVVMILLGAYYLFKGSTSAFLLFVFFGGFGFLLSIKDFIFYKNLSTKRNLWLTNHVGKIVGAFIASVTAFLVAGLSLNNLIAWMLPTILGTIYIVYWKRKLKVKTS